MSKASDPRTDREWMIKLSSQIDELSHSIDQLGEKLVNIEEKKVISIEKRLMAIENKIEQIKGGWKLLMVLWVVFGAVSGWLLNKFT